MAGADKARNKVQKVSGTAKEFVGRATRDRRLTTEGRNDQRLADLKDAGEKIKDVFRPKGSRRRTTRTTPTTPTTRRTI
ncbi:hypothetical protein BST27_22010 [Mycobacterium intermedium]|uniref:CsbD-like domain-containing protein n=1 Tax=Mycobacterium intermedium TaxID=28445 RepID=A0A1T3W7G0_MYCIE|nr:CsbD family protein [Mycobacterium intermedium]MCV6963339.1 CsbD family protein [Mycobacterium intermedium]OPE50285.1 hypothetical protein BV508_10850 [Mycobacterium intermedium]ORA97695.1 hypothetical protein BST27_22010 [Mycobacterium intermedium]